MAKAHISAAACAAESRCTPFFDPSHNNFANMQAPGFETGRIVPLGGSSQWLRGVEIHEASDFTPIICSGEIEAVLSCGVHPDLNRPAIYIAARPPASAWDRWHVKVGEGGKGGARILGQAEDFRHQFDRILMMTTRHLCFTKLVAEEAEHRVTAWLEAQGNVALVLGKSPKHRELPDDISGALNCFLDYGLAYATMRGFPFLAQPDIKQAPAARAPAFCRTDRTETFDRQPLTRTGPAEEGADQPTPHEQNVGGGKLKATHQLNYRGLVCYGVLHPDETFEVLAGGEASASQVASLPPYIGAGRKELLSEHVLVRHPSDATRLKFARRKIFENMSRAARTVTGSTQAEGRWRPVRPA